MRFFVRLSPFSEACLAVSNILRASSLLMEGMKLESGMAFCSGMYISFLNF